jgi:hypothetical protein
VESSERPRGVRSYLDKADGKERVEHAHVPVVPPSVLAIGRWQAPHWHGFAMHVPFALIAPFAPHSPLTRGCPDAVLNSSYASFESQSGSESLSPSSIHRTLASCHTLSAPMVVCANGILLVHGIAAHYVYTEESVSSK